MSCQRDGRQCARAAGEAGISSRIVEAVWAAGRSDPGLARRLEGLDAGGLAALQGEIAAWLNSAEDELGAAAPVTGGEIPPNSPAGASVVTGPPGGGGPASRWVELKMIRGYGPYAYERWYEGGRKRSRYLGRVMEQGA